MTLSLVAFVLLALALGQEVLAGFLLITLAGILGVVHAITCYKEGR